MAKISLINYAPAITQKAKAEEIYAQIQSMNPQTEIVEVDLKDIVAMTTQCARIIFGNLYLSLSSDVYYRNINTVNCSEELGIIIKMGIDHAISTQSLNL